jgi:TetR/AcrR family transcriptional regulator, fatty acid metabolism regulator protein
MDSKQKDTTLNNDHNDSDPPGKKKLIAALKLLLDKKDFNSITTAEIARTANTNEALIYWHFKDKRGLLHQVLEEYLREHKFLIDSKLKKIKGATKKLKKLMWLSFDIWNRNRIYAKIILIEVRSFPGYFESPSYRIVRNYSDIVKDIIDEGISKGEIRNDIPSYMIRDIILGGIEHYVLPSLIFNRKISPKECTDTLCKILLDGVISPNKKLNNAERKHLDKTRGCV